MLFGARIWPHMPPQAPKTRAIIVSRAIRIFLEMAFVLYILFNKVCQRQHFKYDVINIILS